MRDPWERTTKLAEKHSNQGGLFIRLSNNNDKVIGAFCGAPYGREVVWTGERYETYSPSIHTDKKASLRVMMNFFVPSENAMKVIEGGAAWFKDLIKVRDKYGLEKWLFEVERHGEPRDPKTKYTILPEEKLDAAISARIEENGLHNLAALVGDEEEEREGHASHHSAPTASTQDEQTTGLSQQVAGDLASRLRQLSRADVELFLSELGVRRVRDLTPGQVSAAHDLIDRLEREGQPNYSADQDPFA